MSANPSLHLTAPDGTQFYRQVAVFARCSQLQYGVGAVFIREGRFRKSASGSIEASVDFVHWSDDAGFPTEVTEMINEYDPKLQCVVVILSDDGSATCLTLKGRDLGATPDKLFREALAEGQYTPFVPGSLLRLTNPIGEIQPGWFVYMGESGNLMALARAGEDEDGDMVPTEETHLIHVEFFDWFRDEQINVFDERG